MSRENNGERRIRRTSVVLIETDFFSSPFQMSIFGDGYDGYIPYLERLMSEMILEENLENLEPEELKIDENRKLDIISRKCTAQEISKECSICLEKIKKDDNVSTIDCAHTFHYNCIMEWGKYKSECPLCRTNIPILEI